MMVTKNKFHLLVAILATLSFFSPVQFLGGPIWAAEYYLFIGTVSIFTGYLPLVLETLVMLLQHPNINSVIDIVYMSSVAIMFTLYNYAFLGLIAWSFILLSTNSRNWYKLYIIWIFLSLISSFLMSIYPYFVHGGGFGFWVNPLLLLLVAIGELWISRNNIK